MMRNPHKHDAATSCGAPSLCVNLRCPTQNFGHAAPNTRRPDALLNRVLGVIRHNRDRILVDVVRDQTRILQ
jgi:hypothetical protein